MQAVSSPLDTPRPRRTRRRRPSRNGDNGAHAAHPGAPSTNGDNGERAAQPGAPSPDGDNGRDASGRFARGNAGGPGNPFARRLAAFRKVLLAAVTEDDLRAVTAELVRRARDGDVLAMRLLLAYVIGRPTDAVDPDTLDQQEWDIYRQHPARFEDITALLQTMPPDVACLVVRTTLPYIGAEFGRMLHEFNEAERAAAGTAGNPANRPGC